MKTTLLLIICLVGCLPLEGAPPVDPFSPEGQIIKRLSEKTRMGGWEEYSLAELIRYEMLTDMTIEIQRRYHVRIFDYLQYTAEQLEDINKRLFLVKNIKDAFDVHIDWTGFSIDQLRETWTELVRVRPNEYSAYTHRVSKPRPVPYVGVPYSGGGGVKPTEYNLDVYDRMNNQYHQFKVESQLRELNMNLERGRRGY